MGRGSIHFVGDEAREGQEILIKAPDHEQADGGGLDCFSGLGDTRQADGGEGGCG